MSDMIDRAKAKRAMETLHRTRSGYSGMGCNGYLTLTDATAQIIDAIPAAQPSPDVAALVEVASKVALRCRVLSEHGQIGKWKELAELDAALARVKGGEA